MTRGERERCVNVLLDLIRSRINGKWRLLFHLGGAIASMSTGDKKNILIKGGKATIIVIIINIFQIVFILGQR